MKLYRLSMRNSDGHLGYMWFTSRDKMRREVNRFINDHGENGGEQEFMIVKLPPRLTKSAVLELVSRFAGYPDNG